MKYKYLFPYEKIPFGSRIVIYGAGDVGKEYLEQMMMTGYAEVVGFLDRAYDKYPRMVVPLYPPEKIVALHFDYVIIALKMGNFVDDVCKLLTETYVVAKEKIIYQGARSEIASIFIDDGDAENIFDTSSLAYRKATLSIALKLGPGLGDAIIKKRLIMELVAMAPESSIDIYAPNSATYVPLLYRDIPQINQGINDGGGLYTTYAKEYALALSIFFMIGIDHLNKEVLTAVNSSFANKMIQHMENHKKYNLTTHPVVQNWIHYGRAYYRGWNCYTMYRYTDVFQINDYHVPIPLQKNMEDVYTQLGIKNYITFNYGNGITAKGNKESLSKQWPKEYFIKFIDLLREQYHDITMVQVGDKHTDKLKNADLHILGEDLELVKFVLRGAIFHLDIEGGLMHLATQLGTKCIALYGPTQAYLFSYPENINIVSKECAGCYSLYDNTYACAKGYERPECMYSITPELVFEKAVELLEEKRHEGRQ